MLFPQVLARIILLLQLHILETSPAQCTSLTTTLNLIILLGTCHHLYCCTSYFLMCMWVEVHSSHQMTNAVANLTGRGALRGPGLNIPIQVQLGLQGSPGPSQPPISVLSLSAIWCPWCPSVMGEGPCPPAQHSLEFHSGRAQTGGCQQVGAGQEWKVAPGTGS